jgi:predicted enzyme related to lactoylglutathione lyase
VTAPAQDIAGVGRFAFLADPAEAAFAVITSTPA